MSESSWLRHRRCPNICLATYRAVLTSPLLRLAMSGPLAAPNASETKTPQQRAKDNAFLSRTQLCEFNLKSYCRPRHGQACNYAHFLKQLQAPEEKQGEWWKAWSKGGVGLRFHPDYQVSYGF